jgi:hypothetical protein
LESVKIALIFTIQKHTNMKQEIGTMEKISKGKKFFYVCKDVNGCIVGTRTSERNYVAAGWVEYNVKGQAERRGMRYGYIGFFGRVDLIKIPDYSRRTDFDKIIICYIK